MSDDETPTPTPRHRQVLDASAELARELGHSYIGVEHLFLAIVRDRAAVPTQVLARITDLDRVEASVREEMASPGYTGGNWSGPLLWSGCLCSNPVAPDRDADAAAWRTNGGDGAGRSGLQDSGDGTSGVSDTRTAAPLPSVNRGKERTPLITSPGGRRPRR